MSWLSEAKERCDEYEDDVFVLRARTDLPWALGMLEEARGLMFDKWRDWRHEREAWLQRLEQGPQEEAKT